MVVTLIRIRQHQPGVELICPNEETLLKTMDIYFVNQMWRASSRTHVESLNLVIEDDLQRFSFILTSHKNRFKPGLIMPPENISVACLLLYQLVKLRLI